MTVYLETKMKTDLLWEIFRYDIFDVRAYSFAATYEAGPEEPTIVELTQLSAACRSL